MVCATMADLERSIRTAVAAPTAPTAALVFFHRPAQRRATTPQMVGATMADLERSIRTAVAAPTAPTAALV